MRREPYQKVVEWLVTNDAALALSTIVIAEIAYGIERVPPAERSFRLSNKLLFWRKRFERRMFDFDEASALLYGSTVGSAKRSGNQMAISDGMIAAIALRHGASLATRNTSHFEHTGLVLINPWN